ncbi:MAG: hypothetical protein KAS07_04955 [Candidatus Pacebacteria bacterium]|nr:hypothetical protein [Candidatus Paceibacterota bacterium]
MLRRSITIIIVFLFASPFFASAAEFYIETVPTSARVGEFIEAILFLDTQNDTINAIEGSVSYSPHLSVSHIYHGDSFVTFWMKPPVVEGDSIFYAGIVPGGYRGEVSPRWQGYRPGKVMKIVFEVHKSGEAWIQVNRESVVLLHDGSGTEAQLTVKDIALTVSGGVEAFFPNVVDWNDAVEPEPFVPIVIRNPDRRFGGKYYLIFETTDKLSGIHHYEVREGEGGFVPTISPYLLENQKRNVEISVKAVDKAGNERMETIDPVVILLWYETMCIRIVTLALVLLLLLVAVVRRYTQKKK